MNRIVVCFFVLVAAGCAPPDESEPTYEGRCQAPDGVDAAPRTIEDAVYLLDSLPKPVTVECFVESLERPMTVIGSTDFISAQPAAGDAAPRIFAVYDTLIVSWVPDGDGSKVLEFAEEREGLMSVKAEINMPIEGTIAPEVAFDHIRNEGFGTVCGTCHVAEVVDPEIDYAEAYMSQAMKPALSETMRLDDLETVADWCDPKATPRRCRIWDAVFYRGDLVDGDFPRPLPSIYD